MNHRPCPIQRRRDRWLATFLVAAMVALISAALFAEEARARHGLATATASCYGPGLYGNLTANETTLRPTTIGVAHRTFRFGTRIEFRTHNRMVVARVIDRGPFVAGRTFDLTNATVQRLGYGNCYRWGHRTVKWRVVR